MHIVNKLVLATGIILIILSIILILINKDLNKTLFTLEIANVVLGLFLVIVGGFSVWLSDNSKDIKGK